MNDSWQQKNDAKHAWCCEKRTCKNAGGGKRRQIGYDRKHSVLLRELGIRDKMSAAKELLDRHSVYSLVKTSEDACTCC